MLTEADLPEDIDALRALVLEQSRMLAEAQVTKDAQLAELTLAKGEADAEIEGTVRISVCGRAVEHYAAMALMKRSPKMTANWALAMDHSRGGIFHSFSDRFKIR
jgi:hypothetical protein